MLEARELHAWDMAVFLANHWREKGERLSAGAILNGRTQQKRPMRSASVEEFASMLLEPGEKLNF